MIAKDRDWRKFWLKNLSNSKHALTISLVLVPIFFFLMNPDYEAPGYWTELWLSCRIGAQISLFSYFCFTTIYATAYAKDPALLARLDSSVKLKIPLGLAIMMIGLTLSALAEPYITGTRIGVSGISVGMLIGGLAFVLVVFFTAYREITAHYLRVRAESAEANLNVLKNQMQPHFLFNSLNSLAELIHSDGNQAAEMTHRLADLYREILDNSKHTLASASSEFAIVRKYLELEKVRFGERLKYSLREPENSDRIQLPSLVLQTLVENALKHGVAPSIAGGEVEVALAPERNGYVVEIINSGARFQDPSVEQSGRGTGLENTKSRLKLLYGDRSSLAIASAKDRTHVSFWIPGEPS